MSEGVIVSYGTEEAYNNYHMYGEKLGSQITGRFIVYFLLK